MNPKKDILTPEGALAVVVYLSNVDGRVTISKEITALPETWHQGLKDYTYDQVVWGIREYYGRLAPDSPPVLTPAECRRILIKHKTMIEAKQGQLEPPARKGSPPPPHIKEKLDRILKRP